MLEARTVESLDEAARLAPTLPDPSPEGPADQRARRSLRILVGFTILWSVMMFSGALASRSDLVGFVIFSGLGCLGLYMMVPPLRRLRDAIRAPFVREPVAVLERRQQGRARAAYIATVVNRDDKRRDLVVFADPGQLQVGDVGVVFSRDKILWHFHRIT